MKWLKWCGKPAFVSFLMRLLKTEFSGGAGSFLQVCLITGLLFCMFVPPVVHGFESRTRKLVVGVRIDAPPFSACKHVPELADQGEDTKYVCSASETQDSGDKYWGYTVDLCKRIAHRAVEDEGLYCGVEYKEVSSLDRFEMLKDKKIDMLCGASTVTLERMRICDFTLFTFLSGASMMYKELSSGEKKESIKDNFTVGALQNTTTRAQVDKIVNILQENQSEFSSVELNQVKIMTFSSHYEGMQALQDDKINAYIADKEILLALQKLNEKIFIKSKAAMNKVPENENTNGDTLKSADHPGLVELKVLQNYFTVEPYAIGISLGNPDLRFVANSVLSELFILDQGKEDSISAILQKNFPGKTFSKSLENMFRLQQLSMGKRVADDFLPRISRQECNDYLKGQSEE